MRARRIDAATLQVSGIGFLESMILWRLAAAADPSGSEAAQQRLATSPTAGAEPALDKDWEEHVLPELRTLFASAVEIVRGDLVRSWISPGTDAAVRVPLTHIQAWLIGLNQARLALAARHEITEAAMNQRPPDDLQPATLARLFVDFFAELQHLLLAATEDAGSPEA